MLIARFDGQTKGGPTMVELLSLKVLVAYVQARTAVSVGVERVRGDERGEIGSWMILAAGLAVAAAAAVLVLGPWFDQKAADITSN